MICWFPIPWYATWIYGARPIVTYPDAYGEDVDAPLLDILKRRSLKLVEEVLRSIGEESDQCANSWNRQLRRCELLAGHLKFSSGFSSIFRDASDQQYVYVVLLGIGQAEEYMMTGLSRSRWRMLCV